MMPAGQTTKEFEDEPPIFDLTAEPVKKKKKDKEVKKGKR